MNTWEAYRDVVRLGRKTRLPEPQRAILWSIFEEVRSGLLSRKVITRPGMFTELAAVMAEGKNPPFDFAVVDEAQDLGVAHLRFLASLGLQRQDALFFAGDLWQRIFQQPFSWLALGVDIRGRSKTSATVPAEYYQAPPSGIHDFEVLAIDASGNQTITEGTFWEAVISGLRFTRVWPQSWIAN